MRYVSVTVLACL